MKIADVLKESSLKNIFSDPISPFLNFSLQEFKTSGSSNTDTSKVTGTLETKYKLPEYGLTFTEKWSTENTLGTEVCVEDQVTKKRKKSLISI